jgi:hypothetical protein
VIVGRRHLEHVLRTYREHYSYRPHRALQLQPPDGGESAVVSATERLRRRDRLGGLNHKY